MSSHTYLSLDLLVESNKVAFSSRRLDLYPRSYSDLKDYLASNPVEHDEELAVDFGEICIPEIARGLHTDEKQGGIPEIDIEKKLYLEYARYKTNLLPQTGFLQLLSEYRDHAQKEQNGEAKLYIGMLNVLRDQIDSYEAYFQNDLNSSRNRNQKQSHAEQNLEEIASYLISSVISKGIDFQTLGDCGDEKTMDSRDICKLCIDALLDKLQTPNTSPQISESKFPKVLDTAVDGSKIIELQTAFEDLQLAHKYLTEKFEDDHRSYLKQIEQLNGINRELQQELLRYHSQLSQAREHISKLESITPPTSISLDNNSPPLELLPKSPPIVDSAQIVSSPHSMSFVIMKQEFKKLLNETQAKYEKELKEERELRKKLESQFSGIY